MSSVFRIKTYPEILANGLAHYRAQQGVDSDQNVGSVQRTVIEVTALSAADNYVQTGKLLSLKNIDTAKGDDLDRLFLEIGSMFHIPIRRLQARGSVVKVVFGDSTIVKKAQLTADINPLSTVFTVDDADDFPSSGAAYLERGTARQERVVYSRSGNTFTVKYPPSGTVFPHAAFGGVVRVATQSALTIGVSAGATSATLLAGTGAAWPVTGTAIFDRATLSEERKTFTRAGDVLTLGVGLTFAHASGSFVYLSTVGSDRSVPAFSQVFSPATETSRQITFQTAVSTTFFDGDLVSDLVDAACLVVGSDTNVGSDVVTKFSSLPYSNATVTNPIPAGRGRNREENEDYAVRGKNFLSSLSRGIPLALATLVLGLEDEASNSVVSFAQVIQPVLPGVSLLYITDGSTSFTLTRQIFYGRDVVISDAVAGDRRGTLHHTAPYSKQALTIAQRTPRIYASVNRGDATSVGADFLEDTAQNMPTNVYADMYLKAADDQFFLIVSNTTIRFNLSAGGATPVLGPYAILDTGSKIFISSSSTGTGAGTLTDATLTMTTNQYANYYVLDSAETLFKVASNTATVFTFTVSTTPAAGAYKVYFSNQSLPLIPDVDFNMNTTNGDIELVNQLLDHDAVVAASDGASPSVGGYTYTTGLGALVQRAVNGDPSDFSDFPGIASSGTQVLVAAPTIISPSLFLSVIPQSNVSSVSAQAQVKSVVQTYLNSLGIGEKGLLSEIIKRVKELSIVFDVTIVSPTGNMYAGNGQMIRVDASNIDVAA